MVDWKNDMYDEIDAINHILPNKPAGRTGSRDDEGEIGENAFAVRTWIRSILYKIIDYKTEHSLILNEAATTLQLALPNEIVNKNVLAFLELSSYTFELGDEEEDVFPREDEEEEEEGRRLER